MTVEAPLPRRAPREGPPSSAVVDGPALPRELIFLSSLWLVGSWLVSIGVHPPLQPSATTYLPGVRTMVLCIVVGLVIGWPLLRISQAPTRWPLRRTLIDLVSLMALTQVIVWPVRLVTTWGVDRTLAVALVIAAWTAIAGAFIAVATGTHQGGLLRRGAAMLGCCAVCVVGPAVAWLAASWSETRGAGPIWEGAFAAWLGPLVGINTLTSGEIAAIQRIEWRGVLTLVAAAALVWVAVACMAWPAAVRARRGGH